MKGRIKLYFIIILKIILFLGFLILFYAGLIYIYKNISDVIAKNILEYLKVLVWPLVALFAIFIFRRDVSGFLHRLIKGKNPFIGEWEASPVAAQEQENRNPAEIQPVGPEFNQIIVQKEAEISALQNNEQQLVDALTKAQIELDFERIYNFIFSNQIELLKEINSLGGEVSFVYVSEHFKKVQQIFSGLNDWNAAKYLEFLVNNHLLEYKTAIGNFFSISLILKGKAFLAYITSRSYQKYGL